MQSGDIRMDKDISVLRKIFFSGVLGIMIGFCYVAGYELDNYGSLDLLRGGFYVQWIMGSILAALIVFGLFLCVEFINTTKFAEKCKGLQRYKFFAFSKGNGIPRWISVSVLLLCWMPAFLSIFPGAFNYDACAEWLQVVEGNITAHHPVIHVLWSGGFVELFYELTGSYNVGIAVYTIMQMVILANIFASVLDVLAEYRVSMILQIFALGFWSLSPVVQLFSVSVTKDTLFAGVEVLFFLYVLRFYCCRNAFFTNKKYLCGFILSAFFTMILRNNGLYIVLFTLAMMAVTCIRNKITYIRQCMVVLAGIALLYGIYVGPVYNVLNVTPGGVEEMLSVPLQQMARVCRYDYDSLETEDLDLLYKVVPEANLKMYKPTVSDFVKSGFDREGFEENKVEFVKLWAKWLIEHPLTYVNSFLINTVDFWYPGAVVDGYQQGDTLGNLFDYQVDTPGSETVLLPGAHEFYEYLSHEKEAQKAPLAFLVLSPGWYLMVSIVIFGYLWCYKKYAFLAPMMILVVSFMTVLLGPMALVRYVLVFYYICPILLAVWLQGEKFCYSANNQAISSL